MFNVYKDRTIIRNKILTHNSTHCDWVSNKEDYDQQIMSKN